MIPSTVWSYCLFIEEDVFTLQLNGARNLSSLESDVNGGKNERRENTEFLTGVTGVSTTSSVLEARCVRRTGPKREIGVARVNSERNTSETIAREYRTIARITLLFLFLLHPVDVLDDNDDDTVIFYYHCHSRYEVIDDLVLRSSRYSEFRTANPASCEEGSALRGRHSIHCDANASR